MDYKFLKTHLSTIYGISADFPEDFGEVDSFAGSNDMQARAMYSIDGHRMWVDDMRNIVLYTVKPLTCLNFEPAEEICYPECTWCDNPYHCRFTVNTLHNYRYMQEDYLDRVLNDYGSIICHGLLCSDCPNKISCDMCIISAHMIVDGRY